MKVLILGGYGFIGAEIMRACMAAGFDCVGLGRSAATGRRLIPGVKWIGADMAALDAPDKWTPHLAGVDAIVNAAGALQDGARDDLEAIHHRSIAALVAAGENSGVKRFIQISAPGANVAASTAFFRTKAAGDNVVRASPLDWTVLKPTLVIGRGAYGGTALLRMLAGFPVMTPLVYGSANVQTVSIDDVAAAVLAVLRGDIPTRRDYDLAEDAPHALRDIVRGFRRQLGFAPARIEPDLPLWIAGLAGRAADAAGAFGWRSPLRSTALKVMSEDVRADPSAWREATGRGLKSFDETLADLPGTAQERIFARAQIALPVILVTLAIFWLSSGVIGLIRIDAAASLLPHFGAASARAMVIAGAVLDIAVALGLLWRPTARAAAVASIIISLTYLLLGTLLAPQIWADPLGPYVKVLPAIALGAVAALLLEER